MTDLGWRTAIALVLTVSAAQASSVAAPPPLLRIADTLLRQGEREPQVAVGEIVDIGPEHIAIRTDDGRGIIEFVAHGNRELIERLREFRTGQHVEAVGHREGDALALAELHPLEPESGPDEPREPGMAQGAGTTEDFEGGELVGWALDPGWQIARYPRGNRCLRGRGHAFATYSEGAWDELALRLRLRLTQGTLHLNVRANGPQRYFVGIQQSGVYLAKQTGPETFFGDLARGEADLPPDEFVVIEVACRGPVVTVRIDDRLVVEYEDRDPLGPGGIAFETLEDSEAYIDDISVVGTGEIEPSPGGVEPTPAGDATPTADSPAEMQVISLPDGPAASPLTVTAAMPAMVDLSGLQKAIRWEYMGGPVGGLGYDVRMQPKQSGIMYVSDAWAGVFKSFDGGKSWAPMNQGITVHRGKTNEAFPVFCLTINHLKPQVVWIGTKDDRGIFRSGNGGQKWEKMDQNFPLNDSKGKPIVKGVTFRGFTVHPTKPKTVWAAAELTSLAWNDNVEVKGKNFDATKGVVFRTDNDGKSWKEVWRGDSLARYVIVNPKNPNIIYISTGIFDRESANGSPKKPGGTGIWKTKNGGNSTNDWSQVNTNLGNLHVGSLAMHPTDPETLLAAAGCNPWLQGSGVYLTTNGGDSWECKQLTPGQAVTAVEFAADGKTAYAGTAHTIYRSQNAGKKWDPMTPPGKPWGPDGIRAGWPIDFEVDPGWPNRIFANAYGGGNFLSDNSGVTWTNASKGYSGAQVRILAVDPKNSSTVYASGRSGVFVSKDSGANWSGLNRYPAEAIDWQMFAMDPNDPSHLIGASLWGPQMLFESHNGGQKWVEAHPLGNNDLGWRCAAFSKSNNSRIYAGVGGRATFGQLQESLPGNGIWTYVNDGKGWHPANDALSQNAHVFDLAVHPTKAYIVYAATYNKGVLMTNTNGKSWQQRNPTPQQVNNPRAISIAMHPTTPDTLYVGLEHAGLYRTTNGGLKWEPFMNGIDANASISSLVFDPTEPRIIYCADLKSGVYRWHNGKSIWQKINLDLWNREVNALAITSDGKTLYAASEGAGVFRCNTAP